MQVSYVRRCHEGDSGNGQHGLACPVAGGKSRPHQRDPASPDNQRTRPPVPQRPETERAEPDRDRHDQTGFVDRRRKQYPAAKAEKRNEHQSQHAMHGADSGKQDSQTIQTIANREQGYTHAGKHMLCCNIPQAASFPLAKIVAK